MILGPSWWVLVIFFLKTKRNMQTGIYKSKNEVPRLLQYTKSFIRLCKWVTGKLNQFTLFSNSWSVRTYVTGSQTPLLEDSGSSLFLDPLDTGGAIQ